MAVWQKGSGLYFVVRSIEVSPFERCSRVDEAVAGKQGTVRSKGI
jgi:hypothetical protein